MLTDHAEVEEKSFVQEVLQNFKNDYSELWVPTYPHMYCNVTVGFGNLKKGLSAVFDSQSFKLEHHTDFHYGRVSDAIQKFFQMSSAPSMRGRRIDLNLLVRVDVCSPHNHYKGRTYEVQPRIGGGYNLIAIAEGEG